ncbi:MAG TPA: c-type cytochrome biogenesis protein CcmI [Burkholderiales bacterium]|nr:c-type cytochrome biogenesis protein CcmI [Burkholderiales bacterium]
MIAFWLIAALFVAVALLLVLLPLLRQRKSAAGTDRDATNVKLYRDELDDLEREHGDGTLDDEQYREARQEIERRLLEDVAPAAAAAAPAGARSTRWAALAVGIALPLVAVLGYLQFGDIKALDPMVRQEGHPVTPTQIAKMVDELAQRLKQNPGDANGWAMLGRSNAVLGRYQVAADAYARATALEGDDPNLLADYADTLAMARGGNLVGEPMGIVQRGLKVDPNNVKLLALAGSAEFTQKNYAAAVQYWERSLAHIAPGSDFRREVEGSIEEARRAGNLPAAKPAAQAMAKTAGPASAESITGTVKLAPALVSQVQPGDTLFVFARPAKGAAMPVAILRVAASQLPYAFRLDDSLAMGPGNKLSSQDQVVVGARISKSGNALPRPGDLEGMSAPVAPGTSGLALSIDRVVR